MRLLAALALVLLAQCALAVRVTNSHSLVRRNTLSFEAEREESEFPLCPSPDSDDEMECPKRNGICCSFEGRPTGRCCAQGETCTSDDPPQCVAYAGMRHLDTLVEKMDTGLHHVDHLDEGELPAILGKKKKVVVEEEDEKPSSSKSSKSSRTNGSIRDEKLELLREDLLSLEGKAEQDAKYLTQTEYDDVEKELRTLAPPTGSFQQDSNSTSSQQDTNTTSETPEEILQREQAEEAERKEKEIEYAKQHENEKDKLEDMIESEVEHDNSKIVDNEIRREHPNRKVIRVVRHAPAPAPSASSSSSRKVVVDHVNMVEQRRRVEDLKAKIAELEEPLKLQVEPDEAAVHALNYLKARLREMEEEGVHPTDSHKNNAREFLRAIENVKPKSSTTSSDGCNSDGIGDCVTTSSATNDAPVEITSQIRAFLPKGALPSNCMVGITC